MKARIVSLAPATAFALAFATVVACQAEGEEFDSGQDFITESTPLTCESPPPSRTYVGFDQTTLNEKRVNEALDVNRARFKPFAVMADEYKRVLGAEPKSLPAAREAFGDVPQRWFAEPVHSGVSLNAVYNVALEGCTATVAAAPDKNRAPTAETAGAFCKDLMTRAFSEEPSAEQLAACVDLATNKLANVSDARTRWAQTCATILSSTPFLTY